MGIDKCANCLYRPEPVEGEHCKDCNAANNSKNWVYNDPSDEEQEETEMEEPKITYKRMYIEAKKSLNFQTYTVGFDVDVELTSLTQDDLDMEADMIATKLQAKARRLVVKQIELDRLPKK